MTSVSSVTALAAGSDHTCAVFETGALKCWGSGYYGQLGDGTVGYYSTPQDVIESGGTIEFRNGFEGIQTVAELPAGNALNSDFAISTKLNIPAR